MLYEEDLLVVRACEFGICLVRPETELTQRRVYAVVQQRKRSLDPDNSKQQDMDCYIDLLLWTGTRKLN